MGKAGYANVSALLGGLQAWYEQGQPIARIFAQPHVAQDARMVIQEAIDIGEGPVEPRNLIEERIT